MHRGGLIRDQEDSPVGQSQKKNSEIQRKRDRKQKDKRGERRAGLKEEVRGREVRVAQVMRGTESGDRGVSR